MTDNKEEFLEEIENDIEYSLDEFKKEISDNTSIDLSKVSEVLDAFIDSQLKKLKL
jgi:ClpP class serine protease